MKSRPKFSVIIPVYNAEKTLIRCIDSLVKQNYANVEIILVNDGSTDSSDTICRDYASKWNNIVFISKENGGVSSARNAGLDVATGEYVTFVDSDDYVSRDYFTCIDGLTKSYFVEFFLFSYFRTNGKTINHRIFSAFASGSQLEYISTLCQLIYKKTINAPWCKIYRNEIIQKNNVRFREDISIGEDRLFNISYALCCGSMCVSDKPIYYVSTENENSLSRKRRTDLQEQFLLLDSAIDDVVNQIELEPEYKDQVRAAVNFAKIRSVYAEAKRMHQAGESAVVRRKYIKTQCEEIADKKVIIPNSRFCKVLYIPVRWKWLTIIDCVALWLARKK